MSWALEFMPWPLERLIRQYLGFSESVIKEYEAIVEYEDCLRDKRSHKHWIIAQWRGLGLSYNYEVGRPYIYQFRDLFRKDCNKDTDKLWLEIRISEPFRLYKGIVKSSVVVGRVI